MGANFDIHSVTRTYAVWAPFYDFVFGPVFETGRHAAIVAAEQVCGSLGGRILEVGVGTGISLPDYARCNPLVGVDLSEPMLRKAQARIAEHGLRNVEALAVMDAEHLALPDKSFDVVVAQYVITVVPHCPTNPSMWWWRNMSSPWCRIRKPRSMNSCASSGGAARSC